MRRLVTFILSFLLASSAWALDVRHLSETNEVDAFAATGPLNWYQGESVAYDVYARRSGLPLSLSGCYAVWEVLDPQMQQVYVCKTGSINVANGKVSFELLPTESKLRESNPSRIYQSFVRAYQNVNGTNRYVGVLSQREAQVLKTPGVTAYAGPFLSGYLLAPWAVTVEAPDAWPWTTPSAAANIAAGVVATAVVPLAESDPIFGSWLATNPAPSLTESDPDFHGWLSSTPPIYEEEDPVFGNWLATNPTPLYAESDPDFSDWLSDTPPLYAEEEPAFASWLATNPPAGGGYTRGQPFYVESPSVVTGGHLATVHTNLLISIQSYKTNDYEGIDIGAANSGWWGSVLVGTDNKAYNAPYDEASGIAFGNHNKTYGRGICIGYFLPGDSYGDSYYNVAYGDSAIAIGNGAYSLNSVVIGRSAYGNSVGTAIGPSAQALAYAVAIGDTAHASGTGYGVGIGANVVADNMGIAFGYRASGPGNADTYCLGGIGIGAWANGSYNAIAIGNFATAANTNIAIGYYATASGTQTIAMGHSATNTDSGSVLIGAAGGLQLRFGGSRGTNYFVFVNGSSTSQPISITW